MRKIFQKNANFEEARKRLGAIFKSLFWLHLEIYVRVIVSCGINYVTLLLSKHDHSHHIDMSSAAICRTVSTSTTSKQPALHTQMW